MIAFILSLAFAWVIAAATLAVTVLIAYICFGGSLAAWLTVAALTSLLIAVICASIVTVWGWKSGGFGTTWL